MKEERDEDKLKRKNLKNGIKAKERRRRKRIKLKKMKKKILKKSRIK